MNFVKQYKIGIAWLLNIMGSIALGYFYGCYIGFIVFTFVVQLTGFWYSLNLRQQELEDQFMAKLSGDNDR